VVSIAVSRSDTVLAEPVEGVEQITGAAGQAVEPANHHSVARASGLEEPGPLLALPRRTSLMRLFTEPHGRAARSGHQGSCLQRRFLRPLQWFW
jgi:hypothetical protein